MSVQLKNEVFKIRRSEYSMNIKMYSCISLDLTITQIKIPRNVVDDFGA